MKLNRSLTTGLLAVAALALASAAFGDDPPPAPAPAAAPTEHKVARGDFRVSVVLPALVTAKDDVELSLNPKEWADLSVERAVAHGAKVRKGDVLVVLDTTKITEQIAELEAARQAAALTLRQGEEALSNLEAATPVLLAAADTARVQAADDLAYFEKTGRKEEENAARWMVQSSEQALEGAEEELDQLTKMYEADDLTEETEEIVVRRARYAVDGARKRLDSVRLSSEFNLSAGIPRQHETLRVAAKNAGIAAENARSTLPRALEIARLATAKAKEDDTKAAEKLPRLRHDLDQMEIRAPRDGYAYYGQAIDGKWESGAIVAKKLVPGGKLAPREIFMTLVSGEVGPLVAVVPEDKLFLLKEGDSGTATPAFDPRLTLPVRLGSIAHAPQPGGGFLARLNVDAEAAPRLAPGMNVKVTLVPIDEKNVLTVPSSAVFQKDGASFVTVKKEAGNEAVAVTSGATDGSLIVIISGLNEGDTVLTTRP